MAESSLGGKKVSFANDLEVLGKPSGPTKQDKKDSDEESTSSKSSLKDKPAPGGAVTNPVAALANDTKEDPATDNKKDPATDNKGVPETSARVSGLPPRPPPGKPPVATQSRLGPPKPAPGAPKPEEPPKKFEWKKLPEEEKLKVVTEQSTSEAIKSFELSSNKPASECIEINLSGFYPAIVSMDTTLGSCGICEHLSLCMNKISVIENLSGMRSLKVLSLGRNRIKSLQGLSDVSQSLEELWISHNEITTLEGVERLQNLQVLQMAYNSVSLWSEFCRLAGLPRLKTLYFKGNPVERQYSSESAYKWRFEVSKVLRDLKSLDNVPMVKSKSSGEGGGTLQDLEIPDIINTY